MGVYGPDQGLHTARAYGRPTGRTLEQKATSGRACQKCQNIPHGATRRRALSASSWGLCGRMTGHIKCKLCAIVGHCDGKREVDAVAAAELWPLDLRSQACLASDCDGVPIMAYCEIKLHVLGLCGGRADEGALTRNSSSRWRVERGEALHEILRGFADVADVIERHDCKWTCAHAISLLLRTLVWSAGKGTEAARCCEGR